MKLKDAYKDFDLAFVEIYVESNKGTMYNHFIDSDDEDEYFHLEDKYPDVEGVISIDLKKGGFVFKGTYQEPERKKRDPNLMPSEEVPW